MIKYLQGDVTQPQLVDGEACIIAHIVNDDNKFGSGIAGSIAKRYPYIKKAYHEWANRGFFYNDDFDLWAPFQLGYNQVCDAVYGDRNILIVNMLAQHSLKSNHNKTPLRTTALLGCLEQLNEFMNTFDHSVGVHMGKIGSLRGGGDWPTILSIIEMALGNQQVYIYEYDENVQP